LELFLPIRILTRGQLEISLRYPCEALRKPKGVNCGFELRVGMKIKAVPTPNRIICGKAESWYGNHQITGTGKKAVHEMRIFNVTRFVWVDIF